MSSDQFSLLFIVFVVPIVMRWLLLKAFTAQVQRIMFEAVSISSEPLEMSSTIKFSNPLVISPDLLEKLKQRRLQIFLIQLAATVAQVLLAAFVLLTYVEPGNLNMTVVFYASGILFLPLLPALLRSRHADPIARGGIWWIAIILGVPSGIAIWFFGSSFLHTHTATMAILAIVGLSMVLLLGWGCAIAYLRLRAWLTRYLSPDMLIGLELSFTGTALVFIIANSYGNIRAMSLLVSPFAYLAILYACLHRISMQHLTKPPLRLLVLRVFRQYDGAKALIRSVSRAWTPLGPVTWLGATDVAPSSVDASNLLAFLTGRLRKRFLSSHHSVNEILSVPEKRYHDGSYEVRDFYCNNNTWRLAVDRLMRDAHLVLMDLRGFSVSNQGSKEEIAMLAHNEAFNRVIILVDHLTSIETLENTLHEVGKKDGTEGIVLDSDQTDDRGILRALLAVAMNERQVQIKN